MLVTFFVVSFNQEKTILESLESIKHQLVRFNSTAEIQLIISDDGSQDRTYLLEKAWVDAHRNIFTEVQILPSDVNRGIVGNLLRCYPHIRGDYYIGVAGDDLLADADIISHLENKDMYIFGHFLFRDYKILPEENFLHHYLFWESPIHVLQHVSRYIYPFESQTWVRSKKLNEPRLYEIMKQYKYLDDMPTWNYYLEQYELNIGYVNIPIELYRKSDAGVTSKYNEANAQLTDDINIYYKENVKRMRKPMDKYIAKVYELEHCFKGNAIIRKVFSLVNPCKYYTKVQSFKQKDMMKRLASQLDNEFLGRNQVYLEEIRKKAHDLNKKLMHV